MDIPLFTILRLILYVGYLILWHGFNIFKIIRRMIGGTVNIPFKCARAGRIIAKYRRDVAEVSRREDFLTIDSEIMSIYELMKPNWTVYSIDNASLSFFFI